jgi:hypothetical protein
MNVRHVLLVTLAAPFLAWTASADDPPCHPPAGAPAAPLAGSPAYPSAPAGARMLTLDDGTLVQLNHDQNAGVLTLTILDQGARPVAIGEPPVLVADAASWNGDREMVFVAVPGSPRTFRIENANLKSATLAGRVRFRLNERLVEADLAKASEAKNPNAEKPAAGYGEKPNANPPYGEKPNAPDTDKPNAPREPGSPDGAMPPSNEPISPASPTGLREPVSGSSSSLPLRTSMLSFGDARFEASLDSSNGTLTLRPVGAPVKEIQSAKLRIGEGSDAKTLTFDRIEDQKAWRIQSADLKSDLTSARVSLRIDGRDQEQALAFTAKGSNLDQGSTARASTHLVTLGTAKFDLSNDARQGRLTVRLMDDAAVRLQGAPTITLTTDQGPKELTLQPAPGQTNVWIVDAKEIESMKTLRGRLHARIADKDYDEAFDLGSIDALGGNDRPAGETAPKNEPAPGDEPAPAPKDDKSGGGYK